MYSEIGDDGKEVKALVDSRLTASTKLPLLCRIYGFLQFAFLGVFVYLTAFVFVEQPEVVEGGDGGEAQLCVFDQHPILCTLGVFAAGALFNSKDKSAWNIIL